jgi:hypothetical protein
MVLVKSYLIRVFYRTKEKRAVKEGANQLSGEHIPLLEKEGNVA